MTHYNADETLISLGHEIWFMRERAGMTQAELAKKLRTKKEVVSRIETGQYNLLLRTLLEIAHIFGRRLQMRLIKRKGAA